MSRWVDIRLCSEDMHRATCLMVDHFAPVTMSMNYSPPSAAPGREGELSIQDQPMERVTSVLRGNGISVLAARTRLDQPFEPPGDLGA